MSFSFRCLQVRRPSVLRVHPPSTLPPFEAGMVASMMIAIRRAFPSRTARGSSARQTLGSSCGHHRRFSVPLLRAPNVLVVGQFCIGFSALFAVLIPTAASLSSRGHSRVVWGSRCVHHLSWINKHGARMLRCGLGSQRDVTRRDTYCCCRGCRRHDPLRDSGTCTPMGR